MLVIAAEQLCKKVTSHYSAAELTVVDDVDGEEGGVGFEEVSSVFEVGVVKVEGIDEMSPV